MVDYSYDKQVEEVRRLITRLEGISLKVVIKVLSGYEIKDFNKDDPSDKALLNCLISALNSVMDSINKEGIKAKRPNEAGNKIEKYVKDELNKLGCTAETPQTKTGKRKSSGYPDIVFKDLSGRINYLECKTFNKKDLNSSLRTFYLSPSKDFKVITSAHHFLVSFEMVQKQKSFYVKGFKLLTLEKLTVNVKNEFNASNRELYKPSNILYELSKD